MSASHTPGPWSWIGPYQNGAWLLTGRDSSVIHCPLPMKASDEDRCLIAAAPDLLSALEGLVKINEDHNECLTEIMGHPPGWKDSYLDAARNAIAKAKAKGSAS